MFLGAIGHPDVKPGILEVGILLKTRFALDQYINLRPIKLYPNVETPLKDKGTEQVPSPTETRPVSLARCCPRWPGGCQGLLACRRDPHPAID